MNKTALFLLAAMATSLVKAEEANSLYFTDAAMLPGETANIELCMHNEGSSLSCIEAEIQLPQGISVVCDEAGSPVATLYRNRISSHTVLSNVLPNGHLKLLISAIDGSCFTGQEGPLMSFSVRADQTMSPGEYAMETTGETLMVDTAADAYYSTGVAGNILLTDNATAIDTRHAAETSEPIYNLSGQMVEKAGRGRIYIQGGKKTLGK